MSSQSRSLHIIHLHRFIKAISHTSSIQKQQDGNKENFKEQGYY